MIYLDLDKDKIYLNSFITDNRWIEIISHEAGDVCRPNHGFGHCAGASACVVSPQLSETFSRRSAGFCFVSTPYDSDDRASCETFPTTNCKR